MSIRRLKKSLFKFPLAVTTMTNTDISVFVHGHHLAVVWGFVGSLLMSILSCNCILYIELSN